MLLRCVPPVVALVALLGSGMVAGPVEAASPPPAKAVDPASQCRNMQNPKYKDDCLRQARKQGSQTAQGQDRLITPPKAASAKAAAPKSSGPSVATAPPAAAPGSPAPPMPAAIEISTR